MILHKLLLTLQNVVPTNVNPVLHEAHVEFTACSL